MFALDFKFIIPELFLIFSICLLLVFSLFNNFFEIKLRDKNGTVCYPNLIGPVAGLTGIVLILTILLILNQLNYTDVFLFNFLYVDNYFIRIVKIFILLLSLPTVYLSYLYLNFEKLYLYEFFILYLVLLLGFFSFIAANDFLTLYVSLEIQSLIFFVFIGLKRDSVFSIEASIKYLVLSSLASGFILFGISILYGATSLTNFSSFSNFLLFPPFASSELLVFYSIIFGLLFILVGLFFKLSLAPFHVWTPDVYDGAPTIVTAIMSIFPKIVFLAVLLRFTLEVGFFSLLAFNEPWFYGLLYSFGIFSVVVGTFGALAQTKIKRLLAYSTIGHIGSIMLSFSQGSFDSFVTVLFYLFVYCIITLNFFFIVISLRRYYDNSRLNYISEFSSLLETNFFLTFSLLINLFSIAGIPPFAGFWAKYQVFQVLIFSGSYFTAFLLLILSTISAFYYVRLVKILFFETNNVWDFFKPISNFSKFFILLFTLFNIFLLFFLDLLINFLEVLVNTI